MAKWIDNLMAGNPTLTRKAFPTKFNGKMNSFCDYNNVSRSTEYVFTFSSSVARFIPDGIDHSKSFDIIFKQEKQRICELVYGDLRKILIGAARTAMDERATETYELINSALRETEP